MAHKAFIVTDIGYGDAGKGSVVDYLVRQDVSAVVIRHNGGSQAAHNVVTGDGRHHTFAQFGSGSFVAGVKTHLSRYMLLNPITMFPEAAHLQSLGVHDIWERLSVDDGATIITPWHVMLNRVRELARGDSRHGSCGQGIGETMADSLEWPDLTVHAADLTSPSSLRTKLAALRLAKLDQLQEILRTNPDLLDREEKQAITGASIDDVLAVYKSWLDRVKVVDGGYLDGLIQRHELAVFEGAQGVLLDEWRGFHPYTTWSTTTHANALQLLSETTFDGRLMRLGVMRAYATRHGAGPFVTEDQSLKTCLRDYHNGYGKWQGNFRYGHLDLLAHRYALAACGETDGLVVTGLDRVRAIENWRYCEFYQLGTHAADADKYFQLANNTVAGIRLGPFADLDHQARLTELLNTCLPVYQQLSATVGMPDNQELATREILRTIADSLDQTIYAASFGPTAADKHALVPC